MCIRLLILTRQTGNAAGQMFADVTDCPLLCAWLQVFGGALDPTISIATIQSEFAPSISTPSLRGGKLSRVFNFNNAT